METEKVFLLSQQIRQEIDIWVAKYPPERKRSAVMAALSIVQEHHSGWLNEKLMDAVAEYLDMEPISVYEVASFYSMYELKPVGKHKISVCTNISCMLCGSDEIVAHLKKKLGISLGSSTGDGKFSLKEVECLGACGGAPMFQIGRIFYENLTPAKVDIILASLEN